MRTSALLCALLLAAACGGGGGQPTTGTRPTGAGQPTAQPGQPTQASQPTQGGQPAPAPGAGTVAVTLTGGAHAGSYTGGADPLCSYGFVSPDTWGTQYSVFQGVAPGQLSSVQLVYRPGGPGGEDELFPGVSTLVTIGMGPLFDTENGYTEYEIKVHADPEDSSGSGSIEVSDAGSTAVIHATGTTEDGVGIDATVNCPSVSRG